MGFNDNPIVDENAKRSNASVTAIRFFFSEEAGFICKEEIPDYGVDFNVELINDKSQASSQIFPIQIKSTIEVKTIRDNKFITYPFLTSRLGYILRRNFTGGLITLYDTKTRITYYDYVENIVNRLNSQRKNESWKNQEEVNINIPIENDLTNKKIAEIHKKLSLKFLNINLFLSEQGKRYNIPFYIDEKELEEHKSDVLLHKYGASLLNHRSFDIIIKLLERIDNKVLLNNHKLCLYGAIAYSESANAIEAYYYLSRVKQSINDYDDSDLELIKLITPRIDFLSGNISYSEYNVEYKKISSTITSPLHVSQIRLHLLHLEVFNSINEKKYNKLLEEKLLNHYNIILNINILETNKHYLICQLCESIYTYASVFRSSIELEQNIAHDMQMGEFYQEKHQNQLKRVDKLINFAHSKQKYSAQYANDNNNKILLSFINITAAKQFLDTEFNYLKFGGTPIYSKNLEKSYNHVVHILKDAVNCLDKKHFYRETHMGLNLLFDILTLFHLFYKKELTIEPFEKVKQFLKNKMRQIEKKTGLKPFNSAIEEMYYTLSKYFNK